MYQICRANSNSRNREPHEDLVKWLNVVYLAISLPAHLDQTPLIFKLS